jgi:aminopeptidase YwaD
MVIPLSGQKVIRKILVVFLVTSLFITTGNVLARAQTVPNGTPHKPAFIETVDDLIDVAVEPRMPAIHPMLPITTDIDIIELLQQMNETLILRYLENLTAFGPRLTGTEACNQTATYIYNEFNTLGLTVRYHNWTQGDLSASNVEGTLYGTDRTNIFIICGHYDTVSAGPGADDDGSGVAAVLAAAKIMSKYTFSHTVRFVAFSGEEQGLFGSMHYVEDAYNHNDSIIATLNADMIGFAPSGDDGKNGRIYQNVASQWIVNFTQEINELYSEYIGIHLQPMGEIWGSDHYYFWEYGYDAVFYHEYNFNDYYHSQDDTIEHMNITYATRFSRLILATLAEMAQQPRPVLDITNITGGLGIHAQIINIGDTDAIDITAKCSITGGFLGLINITTASTTPELKPQQILPITAKIFGLGRITVIFTAEAFNTDQVTKKATAFALGPFVLKLTLIP